MNQIAKVSAYIYTSIYKKLKKKKTEGAGVGGAMPSIALSMNKLLLILIWPITEITLNQVLLWECFKCNTSLF